MSHVRSRLAVAALGVLALAGCAVPGQAAAAGVAAEFDGTTVTNEQVDAIFSAWVQGTDGALIASRSEVLTMEMLHDPLLAACAEAGTPIYTSDARRLAEDWFTSEGITTPPSDAFVHSFESQFALAVLALSGGDAALLDIINSAAADATVSPRVGDVDVDAFLSSIINAASEAQQQNLGARSYIPFQHVNAFSPAAASWLVNG